MCSRCFSSCLLLATFFLGALPGHAQTPLPLDEDFRALAQSGTRILGLDDTSAVFASDDGGSNFALLGQISNDSLDRYFTLAALGSSVVAVGSDALIARSTDQGATWSQDQNDAFIFGDLKALAARPGASAASNQWLAAGNDGAEAVLLRSDDDGITWSTAETFPDVQFSAVVWTGTHWLACGLNDISPEAVLYRSSDLAAWTPVTLPDFTAPLKALAADGTGGVLAVGEQGWVLRSVDHGATFARIGTDVLTEDLYSVHSLGADHYMIGGEGKSLFESNNGSLLALQAPAAGAPPVEALLLSGTEVLLAGEFKAMERTSPLSLKIDFLADAGGYRVSLNQGLSGKAYSLESSADLQDWHPVAGAGKGGTGGALEWNLPADGAKRFWRVTEF